MRKVKHDSPVETFKQSIIRLGTADTEFIKVNTNPMVISKIKDIATWSGLEVMEDEIQIPNFMTEDTRVRDVYCYNIKISQDGIELYYFEERKDDFSLSAFNDLPTDCDRDLPTILLLLESPHKYEYSYTDYRFIPIAPYQGKTGRNILGNIRIVIEEINRLERMCHGEYRLIICNPVPYQTSLYVLHRQALGSNKVYSELRDSVWKGTWNSTFAKRDFGERLSNYNPYLILNACTSGVQELITHFLIDKNYIKIFTTNHPASWNGFNIRREG